ncbi:MAG: hypothetical protein HYY37_03290 [Candidatus Aenigmarchaeota archaeon]|nr:hypothetical protein [Candidatus Aenigmarchaeota archaeon]
METEILNKIQEDLEFLKKEVVEIKEHMVDIDSIMTEDDYKALLNYEKEKSRGRLKSHEKLKKELGL